MQVRSAGKISSLWEGCVCVCVCVCVCMNAWSEGTWISCTSIHPGLHLAQWCHQNLLEQTQPVDKGLVNYWSWTEEIFQVWCDVCHSDCPQTERADFVLTILPSLKCCFEISDDKCKEPSVAYVLEQRWLLYCGVLHWCPEKSTCNLCLKSLGRGSVLDQTRLYLCTLISEYLNIRMVKSRKQSVFWWISFPRNWAAMNFVPCPQSSLHVHPLVCCPGLFQCTGQSQGHGGQIFSFCFFHLLPLVHRGHKYLPRWSLNLWIPNFILHFWIQLASSERTFWEVFFCPTTSVFR